MVLKLRTGKGQKNRGSPEADGDVGGGLDPRINGDGFLTGRFFHRLTAGLAFAVGRGRVRLGYRRGSAPLFGRRSCR